MKVTIAMLSCKQVEYDGLEHGITEDLIKKGIPKEDIILAFLPESLRSQVSA
jgi:hypothetical protein